MTADQIDAALDGYMRACASSDVEARDAIRAQLHAVLAQAQADGGLFGPVDPDDWTEWDRCVNALAGGPSQWISRVEAMELVRKHAKAAHAQPKGTEAPALPAVAEARGFVAFGAGVYRVCQTVEPGLVVTFRRPGEEDRAVGERNAAPDLTPIPPEEIIVRLEFRNVAGLDSLEDHLREIRQQHWPETVPNLLVDAMAHANANAWAVTKEWARGWNDARLAIAKAHLVPSPAPGAAPVPYAKFAELLRQEHALSDAYVRLRVILGAMDPPTVRDPAQLWTYVESVAREKLAAIQSPAVGADDARDAASWRAHQEVIRKTTQRNTLHLSLRANIDGVYNTRDGVFNMVALNQQIGDPSETVGRTAARYFREIEQAIAALGKAQPPVQQTGGANG